MSTNIEQSRKRLQGRRPPLTSAVTLARRWMAYTFTTLIGAVVPLLSLPLIAHKFGAPGWTAIAIGQSVGSGGAVCIAFGWPLLGPREAAMNVGEDRLNLLRRARATNLAISVPTFVVVTIAAWLAAKGYTIACLLSAWSTALLGFSLSWYFIGRSSPKRLFTADVGPRVAGALIGILAIAIGGPLWTYPTCGLVVYACALIVVYRSEMRALPPAVRVGWDELVHTLKGQRAGAVTQLASIVYINLPLTLFALVGAVGTAQFAAVDRIYRLSLVALQPITQVFQGWVPGGGNIWRRAWTSIKVHTAIGLLVAVGAPLCFPWISRILFGGTAHIGVALASTYGVIIMVVLLTRAISSGYLVQHGRNRSLVLSAGLGSAIGLVLIPGLGKAFGPIGAAAGVLSAEATVLVIQGSSAYRLTRGKAGEHVARH
jgi:O-antigen/teichoic acid export membrane protein